MDTDFPTLEHLRICAQRGVNVLTPCILQGGFPDEADFALLREVGVTHLINVDLPYLQPPTGFHAHHWTPIIDFRLIPERDAIRAMDTLHACLREDGARVYVHCHAGIQRSATLVWLYLIACGVGLDAAADGILARGPKTIPGHPALVNRALAEFVVAHGAARYLPHGKPEALALQTRSG